MKLLILSFILFLLTTGSFSWAKRQTPLVDCTSSIAQIIRAMPKAHLHVHLEGNVRFSTILDLAKKNHIDLGYDIITQRQDLFNAAVIVRPEGNGRVEGLERFLNRFNIVQKVLNSYESIKRVTLENIEDAHNEGVTLLELRFAPAFMSIAHPGLSHEDIFRAVVDGTMEGLKKYPYMQIGLIHILVRLHKSAGDSNVFAELNRKAAYDLFSFLKSGYRGAEHIVGFDLAGAEIGTEFKDYDEYVLKAKDARLKLTVHTGEDSSPEHMLETILRWSPDRIGHGIQATGNNVLIGLIKKRRIHQEIAPTSNWLTQATPNIMSHPLKEFFKKGVSVSLNTDDGHLQNIDLIHEYVLMHEYFGFSIEDFMRMNQQAFSASFIKRR